MVPIKCGNCNHKQLWKCKGGPRLKDITCGNCGAALFKRDTYAERKARVNAEAQAEERAAAGPEPLPSEHQISYCTMKALERMAAALEDLRAAALEAGYGRAMLTGQRRPPAHGQTISGTSLGQDQHEPAPGRVHSIAERAHVCAAAIKRSPIYERMRYSPRIGDMLEFGGGRKMEVTAASSHAVVVAEFANNQVQEHARRLEEWQRALEVAERISEGPEPAQEAPAELQSAGGAR